MNYWEVLHFGPKHHDSSSLSLIMSSGDLLVRWWNLIFLIVRDGKTICCGTPEFSLLRRAPCESWNQRRRIPRMPVEYRWLQGKEEGHLFPGWPDTFGRGRNDEAAGGGLRGMSGQGIQAWLLLGSFVDLWTWSCPIHPSNRWYPAEIPRVMSL